MKQVTRDEALKISELIDVDDAINNMIGHQTQKM